MRRSKWFLAEEGQQNTCRHCRTYHTRYVRTHSVHKEEVRLVVLLTYALRYTGCHRHCRYTCRTDKWVNLVTLLSKQVHKLCKENSSVIRSINDAKSDILFVCFGFPLQERWIAENLPSLPSVRLAMGLGGSLDVWSGNIRRAPSWVQNIGLEWLWRTFREPKRAKRLLSLPKGLVSAITTKECRS